MHHPASASTPHLDGDALEAFTAAVCVALGTPDDIAADVATVLVSADRRGIPSHGTARLGSYVALIDAGPPVVHEPSPARTQPPAARLPPSTCTVVPVTNRERSDAR